MGLRIFNLTVALLSSAFVVLKFIADWIGRTTVTEDANSLREKLAPMLNWAADQPGVLYAVAMALFAISAFSLFWQWRNAERLAPIFGVIEYRATGKGFAYDLPIKVRSWQGVESRITLELRTPDDERVGNFVLQSEQAAKRGVPYIRRVILDDTFKRFELINYHMGTRRLGIASETGEYEIPAGHYRFEVTVSGAGPARSRLFTTHTFDAGLRLSDGTEKGSQDVIFEDEAELLPAASGLAGNSLRLAIEAMDDLKAEGVKTRNALLAPVSDFDLTKEQEIFEKWRERAMEALERFPHHRSRIRTLDRFQPPTWKFEDARTADQIGMEAIWSEGITRLDDFIQKLGAKLTG